MQVIPFNRPSVVGKEISYIAQVIQNGHLGGDGEFTKKCNQLLEQELGVPKVFLTTSCTHVLELSSILLNITIGDEVIVPSFTFVSTTMHLCFEVPSLDSSTFAMIPLTRMKHN